MTIFAKSIYYQDFVSAFWTMSLYTNKDSEVLKQNFSIVLKEGISPNLRKRMWNLLIPLGLKFLRIMTFITWTLLDKKRTANRGKCIFCIIQNKIFHPWISSLPEPGVQKQEVYFHNPGNDI